MVCSPNTVRKGRSTGSSLRFSRRAVRCDYTLAEIPIPLEHEQLFDSSVPDLQHAAEGIFFHLVQRLSCLRRLSNRRLQLFRQFDQRFALDSFMRMSHAHCAASVPG